jgi:hypothetical protein
MNTDSRMLHLQARYERALFLGSLIARACEMAAQFISKAWRSSSSRGTNSSALS